MVVSLDEKSLLESLNLTSSQVKVYLALICHGPSKVSQISKYSGIHRTHLYQILHALENQGLTERNLANGVFTPVPLKEALEMVIWQKRQELEKVEATAKAISDASKPQTLTEKKPEIVLLTNPYQISKKIQSSIEDSRETVCLMQMWSRFQQVWEHYYESLTEAMTKGVKIKQIVEYPEDKQQGQRFLTKRAFSNPNLQIRFVSKTGGNFVIIDDEKILLSTSAEKKIPVARPMIFSNYKGLLEPMQNYFSVTWENAFKGFE